jgi:hypothetical protein
MSKRQFAGVVAFLFFMIMYVFVLASSDTAAPPTKFEASPANPLSLASLETTPSVAAPSANSAPVPPADRSRTKEEAADAAMSAAAIAALIVQKSRQQYYATGHPCACPDDLTRTGRRCGNMSAYIRPGGAAPLCYASDLSAAMIDQYRSRTAARN